jgi:hypothetical protein
MYVVTDILTKKIVTTKNLVIDWKGWNRIGILGTFIQGWRGLAKFY